MIEGPTISKKINKKNIHLIIVFLLVIIGFSYAFFSFTKISNSISKVVTGDIYMHYTESNQLSIPNCFPMTKEEGLLNSYFDFIIDGKNQSSSDIYYIIKLNYGNNIQGLTRLNDEDVVVYLTEVIDGEEIVLVDAIQFYDLDDTMIWIDNINSNTNSEIEHEYRLRIWVSEGVIISDTDPDASYTTEEFRNIFVSLKVSVVGDMQEEDINMLVRADDSNIINGRRAIDISSYGTNTDNLVLNVTCDNPNIEFMYEDSIGNESVNQSSSLNVSYSFTSEETVVTRVILIPLNDANTVANISFNLTRNGSIVERQIKRVLVYGNNYCLNNGFDKLGECLLVSDRMSNSVNDAKNSIASKNNPDFSLTAPQMNYLESVTSDVENAISIEGYQYYVARTYTFNNQTGKYSLTSPSAVILDNSGTYNGYYTCGGTNITPSACSTMYYIKGTSQLENTGTVTLADVFSHRVAEVFDESDSGLYKTIDNYGYTYYYRGNVTNNNVRFAGIDWKVLRVNGDGSIRMITSNTVGDSPYNLKYQDPTYTGYTYNEDFGTTEKRSSIVPYSNVGILNTYYYGTSYTYNNVTKMYQISGRIINGTMNDKVTAQNLSDGYIYSCFTANYDKPCQVLKEIDSYSPNSSNINVRYISYSSNSYLGTFGNDNDSTIKQYLDSWYQNNLASYDSQINDTIFCNDRSITEDFDNSGYLLYEFTNYAPLSRNVSNNPSLLCANQNDRYTVNNTIGNKWLDYSIGLITVDEIVMAGGVYNNYNERFYLENNTEYWTMSPAYFGNSNANSVAWRVMPKGYVTHGKSVVGSVGVRPVINLKSSVTFASGTGTSDNPYEISN